MVVGVFGTPLGTTLRVLGPYPCLGLARTFRVVYAPLPRTLSDLISVVGPVLTMVLAASLWIGPIPFLLRGDPLSAIPSIGSATSFALAWLALRVESVGFPTTDSKFGMRLVCLACTTALHGSHMILP